MAKTENPKSGNKLQAQNDLFTNTGLTEDSSNIVTLDVMSNDGGGKGISLWSLDDGVNAATDLLTQDAARTRETSTDRSNNGALIWITPDGRVGYDISTVSESFKTQLQGLTTGETLTDTFTYAVTRGNTLSWATAAVQFNGINDPSVLSSAIVPLAETNAPLSTSGTLSISDIDTTESFLAQAGTAGTYGTFAIDASGVWTYTAGAHNEFVADTIYTEVFNVASTDGSTSTVTLYIVGTNDAAVLSSAIVPLTESNAILTTSGILSISDIDSPNTFVAQVATAGAYGIFSVNNAGAWTYTTDSAHDEFAAGTTYTDSFTVTSADGTTTNVTMNILGTSEVPVISGVSSASVTEDTNLANQILSFSTPSVHSVSASYPQNVAVADVSGDGKPDIVAVDAGSNAVSVLLGNGHGGFGAASLYGVGAVSPFGVAITDINGDSKPDIVTADTGSGAVSVLLSNGPGTFSPPSVFGVGASIPYNLAVADVNGDDKPDIVTSNYNSNNVSVLLGNGLGSFSVTGLYSVGSAFPFDIAMRDVNNDGKLDIVTTNVGSNNVSVLLGNGIGGFGAANIYSVSAVQPRSVALADVNGDGNADIVTSNYVGNNVSVLLGDGLGGFGAANVYSVGAFSPNSVALADVNGDYRPDIVTTDANSHAVSVLLNDSRADLFAIGSLSISDLDAGESSFIQQTNTLGNHGYGRFSIDASGAWQYMADNNQSAIQELDTGETLTDSFTVSSFDGLAHQEITVTIVGVAEMVV
ncbi:VCBS domain-containing protein [Nitrosomonas sp. wSCUT-2]